MIMPLLCDTTEEFSIWQVNPQGPCVFRGHVQTLSGGAGAWTPAADASPVLCLTPCFRGARAEKNQP